MTGGAQRDQRFAGIEVFSNQVQLCFRQSPPADAEQQHVGRVDRLEPRQFVAIIRVGEHITDAKIVTQVSFGKPWQRFARFIFLFSGKR